MTGCSKTKPENDIVDNCLIEKFPAEEITTIVFVQGKGTMRDAVRCNRDENAEDIDSVVKIFGKVSSDCCAPLSMTCNGPSCLSQN